MMTLLSANIKKPFADLKTRNSFLFKNFPLALRKLRRHFIPNTVIVRFSDFKTNEYRNLMGGEHFEPQEENPMIGWRGASRYYSRILSAKHLDLNVRRYNKSGKKWG